MRSRPPKSRRSAVRPSRTVAGFAVLSAMVAGGPAFGQTAASPIGLDEISVTGNRDGLRDGPNLTARGNAGSRLTMTPLETPASVDIISGDVIRDRGQNTLAEAVTQNAAGFSYLGTPGNGFGSFGARGFTGVTSVTVLYDGIRLYPALGTVSFPFDTWTAERIEVLRGPASVLYGEGAIGGAMNIIPKRPTDVPRNEVRFTGGSNGQVGLAVGSSGRITDRISYSVDISGNRGDGWMDRGDYRNLSFSGALNWRPTDEVSITLSHDGGHNQPTRYFGTPLRGAGIVEPSWIGRNYNVTDGAIRLDDSITQLRAVWTPNDRLTLRAVAYYIRADRWWQNTETYRWNAGTGLIARSDFIAIKQQLAQVGARVDGTFRTTLFGMANETVVGFDVNRFDFRRFNNGPGYLSPIPNPALPPLGFDPGFYGSASSFGADNHAVTNQYSVFLDNRLKLTEAFSLVGGLRYDHPQVYYRNERTGAESNTLLDSVSWRLGAVYEPIRNLAFYAQYSVAADPVTSLLTVSPTQTGFSLSQGRQVEVGVKQSLWNGRLEWSLAAYHIVKNNLLSRDPNNPAVTVQVGQQSSRGIEASVGFDLGRGWRVGANGTILQARYDDFRETVGGVALSRVGNAPAGVPQQLANLWVSWNFAENWTASAGLQYVGKTYTSASNDYARPAYVLVNAGLQWRATQNATLDLRVKNLFDTTYAYTGGDFQWYFGAPRTVEASLRVRF